MPQDKETSFSRIKRLGVHTVSVIDLLSMMLANSEEDLLDTSKIATEILSDHSIFALSSLSASDFQDLTSKDYFQSIKILSAIELGRRIALAARGEIKKITCAKDVVDVLRSYDFNKKEHLVALLLDRKQQILAVKTIHIGTDYSTPVSVKDVYREAVKEGASAIILAHNHPSGDPQPSSADIEITQILHQAGELLEITLLDHVIIGMGRFVSLKEQGFISEEL